MESDMAAYKSDFLQEVYECLDVFNQSFVDLENGEIGAIDEIFRITHTIKGMAGFLGYISLEHLCHSMEGVLCGIKNGDIEIDGELVDILLSTVDRITEIVKQIESADNDSVKIDDLLKVFENYEKMKDDEQEPLCPFSIEKKNADTMTAFVPQTEEIIAPSEYTDNGENGIVCNQDACNLVLDLTLAKDCVMKDLRAALVIESLRDFCNITRTDPYENELDNTFDGHLKVFLSGDRDKVEGAMDRISEIESFDISEIKLPGTVCDEEFKATSPAFNSPVAEEKLSDTPLTSFPVIEEPAVSTAEKSNSLHSYIYSLALRLRCIPDRISRSINCFKITESAGILPNKKCNESSPEVPKSREVRVPGTDPEVSPAVPGQESQPEEAGISEPVFDESVLDMAFDGPVPDKIIPDEIISDASLSDTEISDPELLLDKVRPPVEKSEATHFPGPKPQEARESEEPEAGSSYHLSESAAPAKVPLETQRQETIRVRTSNLDNIMNLVGELVINKGRLLQISQEYNLPELEEATGTLDKSISSLQDEVMRIRMVKIERVFSKFPRMVRDLSRKFDKNIEFEIEGQDTELDRTILDEISDPLVHLVRNAVDHGIEYPEEREKAGKNEVGHIKLSARREKNNVIIEIEDDGKGIDVELLKKKAVEKGLFSAFDVENFSEEEIRMIIFAPGFSTKESPTEISGRGVGMDAVKTAVEKLGGKVRVYSKKGEFTRIRIDLPPTVAIIKSLLVEVGPETYAIPISNVVKALSVDSSDYKLIKETPVLYIRDKLIPTAELKEIFHVECKKADKEIAIIVEKENEEVGLIVDSIIDQQEIVIKPLGNIFSNSKGFIGATILGDGRVIPIIDVSMLIKGDIDD
ncbi:Signal transduction histidine kinase CheA [Methanosarcina siciliae C2J]|uniref:Chemotaxis protein CheA n=1 Tax=Methanosarcina siciliae C2J TaxID=1434118 RepID=A0A0E3PS24_9EURY|nr:chemotaxis protein CheA [Methanosarcina siciliae]AKB37565.1 Signal transduction histidine kinase CheA [Methanosarcina siciliae C2J]